MKEEEDKMSVLEEQDLNKKGQKWTQKEDEMLKKAVARFGACSWKSISKVVGTRNDLQCFHRWQKVLKPGLTKGPWTREEDEVILDMINQGIKKWSAIAKQIPGRLGKQIRERYFNHLDPSIKKSPWTAEEDRELLEAQKKIGNKWAKIAKLLPGRPENMVKNRWNVLNYPRKRSKPNKSRGYLKKSQVKKSTGGEEKVPEEKDIMRTSKRMKLEQSRKQPFFVKIDIPSSSMKEEKVEETRHRRQGVDDETEKGGDSDSEITSLTDENEYSHQSIVDAARLLISLNEYVSD